jgi:hypothetical protein
MELDWWFLVTLGYKKVGQIRHEDEHRIRPDEEDDEEETEK